MTDGNSQENKLITYVKEDINSLRRDVLDIRDSVSTRGEKTVSHLAIQTTLLVIAILVMLASLAFVIMSLNRTSDVKGSADLILDELKKNSADITKKYSDAVFELEQVKNAREDLSRKLADAKAQLLEMRLELEGARSGGEQENAELKRKFSEISDKCLSLEKRAARADALAAQLEAVKQEAADKLTGYEKTIKEMQQRIDEMEKYIREGTAATQASSRPTPVSTTTPRPSAPPPSNSMSPEDIKKKKEREREGL
ncbi:MAG: hypothetical protein WC712_07665 [Candidatus Brocadiia bacterium]